MTNTAIVPVLSFCSTQLSWEDRQGDADFQDRFSRDYIRAETIGRQSGNVPFTCALINGGTDDAKNQWILRTYAGVILTHELKPRAPAVAYRAYWDNFLRLLAFGYGKTGRARLELLGRRLSRAHRGIGDLVACRQQAGTRNHRRLRLWQRWRSSGSSPMSRWDLARNSPPKTSSPANR